MSETDIIYTLPVYATADIQEFIHKYPKKYNSDLYFPVLEENYILKDEPGFEIRLRFGTNSFIVADYKLFRTIRNMNRLPLIDDHTAIAYFSTHVNALKNQTTYTSKELIRRLKNTNTIRICSDCDLSSRYYF
jgi:hypothetical protein